MCEFATISAFLYALLTVVIVILVHESKFYSAPSALYTALHNLLNVHIFFIDISVFEMKTVSISVLPWIVKKKNWNLKRENNYLLLWDFKLMSMYKSKVAWIVIQIDHCLYSIGKKCDPFLYTRIPVIGSVVVCTMYCTWACASWCKHFPVREKWWKYFQKMPELCENACCYCESSWQFTFHILFIFTPSDSLSCLPNFHFFVLLLLSLSVSQSNVVHIYINIFRYINNEIPSIRG